MPIQHKDIPDAQRHEPKGVSTASSGSVYVANGSGSGVWELPKIEGQAAAPTGYIPFKSGSNIIWQKPGVLDTAFVEVDTNETIRSLTGSTEVTVDGQFIDDYSAGKFVLSGSNSLTVVEAGIYILHWSVSVKPQSGLGASNEIIEARINVNGTVSSPFRVTSIQVTKNAAIDDVFSGGGNRIIDLLAGDVITVTLKNLAATRSYKTLVNYNLYRIA